MFGSRWYASRRNGRADAKAGGIEQRTSILFSAFISSVSHDPAVEPTEPNAVAEPPSVSTLELTAWKAPRIRDIGPRE
jgi:hypothetical protein